MCLLDKKSEVVEKLKEYVTVTKNSSEKSFRRIRSDNGEECVSVMKYKITAWELNTN